MLQIFSPHPHSSIPLICLGSQPLTQGFHQPVKPMQGGDYVGPHSPELKVKARSPELKVTLRVNGQSWEMQNGMEGSWQSYGARIAGGLD